MMRAGLFTAVWLLLFSGLLVPAGAWAQPPMATLTGQVVDARNMDPVPGASIWLVPGNISLTATSDSTGGFRMAGIPVGHYALRVAAIGYDTLEVPELWLRAGKHAVQRLELAPGSHELGSVTVNPMAVDRLDPLGVNPFTVEQSLRWAATFFDPGRMVGAFPGVAVVNDEANHLSVRGNSPNANAWLLEGVEIVSPNHTGNAATPSDLPTLSGGGVNMLSAQMLGTSRLLDGVLPMAYDNALGGILDMRLRDGSRERQEWTVQAGLLGLDLSTEGPLGNDKRGSFLANYRYSTVGLLGKLGVDLGDEDITYQDLSFNVALPLGKRGNLHVFGVGGNSRNLFEAEHDTAAWEVDKDSRNIDYTSKIGAVGLRFAVPLGRMSSLRATVAWSASDQERTEERLDNSFAVNYFTATGLYERKLSGLLEVRGRINGRLRYAAGVNTMLRTLSGHGEDTGQGTRIARWMMDHDALLLRPWVNGVWSLTEHVEASLGMGLSWYSYTDAVAGDPRARIQWRMRKGRVLALAAGARNQLPQWQAIRAGRILSKDVVLGYHHPFNEQVSLHVEAYAQYLSRVPVPGGYVLIYDLSRFSTINVWDEADMLGNSSDGTARNIGLEVSVDRRFARGYFWQGNISVFNSTYGTPGHADMDTRWNNRYIANLSGGKEFRKEKEDRVRTWGVSGRIYAMGGMRVQPLVPYGGWLGHMDQLNQPWDVELAPFQRLDLRVYLRKDRKGHTGLWAVDLQNVLNRKNEAFRYFDQRQGQVMTKYQLGLIPNLSYRIEF